MNPKKLAKELGADLIGIADLDELRDYPTSPDSLLDGYRRGISLGARLTDPAIDNLPESRPLYAHQYRKVNEELDRISYRLAKAIEKYGFKAQPLPASEIISDAHWRSYISHKAVARAAGLGWIGKSLLLVNPDFGPRIRWATVLTDMELEAGAPLENKCGTCIDCIEGCIVNAFEDAGFDDYPDDRNEYFDVDGCAEKLEEFAKDPNIGSMVCGICIKVCPWGKNTARS